MRTELSKKTKKLYKLLADAKEIQQELINDHGKDLTESERNKVVEIWDGLDKASYAAHNLNTSVTLG